MGFDKFGVEKEKQRQESERKKKIAEDITLDFENRREDRRRIENTWRLNMNFVSGNQYCDVSPFGDLVEEDKQFFWQSKRTFNHIAPLVEARVAKLMRRRPELRVKAFSDEDGDVKVAMLATGVLKYVFDKLEIDKILARGTIWAETCGSCFYKVTWDEKGGRQVAIDENGVPVYEGEVDITVCPPFEIFPDRLGAEGLDEIHSLIHAQAVSVKYIYQKFGVTLQGKTLENDAVCGYSEPSGGKNLIGRGFNKTTFENAEILIEKYTLPTENEKDGKLEIVAGGELLYSGPLPYLNDDREERGLPFVKQDCVRLPGAFFGTSIVDRLIPVQRAYNAVRNRKHEFLNRISMGVLAVEDGSVDTDELSEEGLMPGKVLVYRQGAKPPELMDCGDFPAEFAKEEEWLEKEFSLVSGVSDLSQNSTPARVTSATGLQLLLSQDDSRLAATVESFDAALKGIGKQILRAYRQFAGSARLMTLTGENKRTQVHYFNAAQIVGKDISFECEEKETSIDKKETLLKLLEAGLLFDDEGKITMENKNRILEAFGFGTYENSRDISALHIAKAGEENIDLKTKDVAPDCYDDHELHIGEHTRFLLSSEFKTCKNQEKIKQKFIAHIEEHKRLREEKL